MMSEDEIAEAAHALQLQGDVSTMRTQELGEKLIAEVRGLRHSAAMGWRTALVFAVQYGGRASEKAARDALHSLGEEL